MVQIWNISADLGKRVTVIVNRRSLRPGESISVSTKQWVQLQKTRHLSDHPPKPVVPPVVAPAPRKKKAASSGFTVPALPPPVAVDLQKMTKKKLVAFAKHHGIRVDAQRSKASVLATITESL